MPNIITIEDLSNLFRFSSPLTYCLLLLPFWLGVVVVGAVMCLRDRRRRLEFMCIYYRGCLPPSGALWPTVGMWDPFEKGAESFAPTSGDVSPSGHSDGWRRGWPTAGDQLLEDVQAYQQLGPALDPPLGIDERSNHKTVRMVWYLILNIKTFGTLFNYPVSHDVNALSRISVPAVNLSSECVIYVLWFSTLDITGPVVMWLPQTIVLMFVNSAIMWVLMKVHWRLLLMCSGGWRPPDLPRSFRPRGSGGAPLWWGRSPPPPPLPCPPPICG